MLPPTGPNSPPEPELHEVFSRSAPAGGKIRLLRQTFSPPQPGGAKKIPRLALIAGLHGDELEGVYVCILLSQYLRRLLAESPESLRGEVHIYPTVNPRALDTASRLWPFFHLDMNRTLGEGPGRSLPADASAALLEDLRSSCDLAVDIHASNLQLFEIPQVRIIEDFAEDLLPLAELCRLPIIWVHPMAPVFESTLAYNLNQRGTPALVIETGICLRIHREQGNGIFAGIVNLMRQKGILAPGTVSEISAPSRVVFPDQVSLIQASQSGIFTATVQAGAWVERGQLIGELHDPQRGLLLETVHSPTDGLIFTLRQHPLTYAGAALARIAGRAGEPS